MHTFTSDSRMRCGGGTASATTTSARVAQTHTSTLDDELERPIGQHSRRERSWRSVRVGELADR